MLSKAHFKNPNPLSDAEILKAMGEMGREHKKVTAKYEAQKGALKLTREDRDDLDDRLMSAAVAHEAGEKVWQLKNGRLSVEGPDGQGILLKEDELEDPTRKKGAPADEDDGDEDGPKNRAKRRAAATAKA